MNYIINKEDFIIFEPLLFQLKEKNINVKEGDDDTLFVSNVEMEIEGETLNSIILSTKGADSYYRVTTNKNDKKGFQNRDSLL